MFYVLFAIILILLLIVDRYKPRNLVKLHRKVGNDWIYLPIIGHAHNFIGSSQDVFTGLIKASSQTYNRKYKVISMWLGHKFFILTGDPIQGTAILKTALEKTFMYKLSKHILGDGLIFAPSDVWHRKRKIIIQVFAPRYVIKFVKIFEKHAKEVVEQLESKVGKGNIRCMDYMSRYAMDSSCETILGVDLGVKTQPNNILFETIHEYVKHSIIRAIQPWYSIEKLYRLLPIYTQQEVRKKTIYDFVDNLIRKKKVLIDATTTNAVDSKLNDTNYKTFLELMIQSSAEINTAYTPQELRQECLTLVSAGTDTSSSGICFAMVLLSQHQDVQEKVYNELQEFLGDINKPIEFADLQKLKYMDAVIKEVLRLYPPISTVTRNSKSDFALPSGLVVPKNCDIVISIFGIHHNPNYWGADVEDFKPQRFLSENMSNSGSFIAFANGPRNCIGQLYGMLSIKTTLATILRRYQLLPATSFTYDKNNPLRLSFELLTKHVDNYEIQIKHRDKAKI